MQDAVDRSIDLDLDHLAAGQDDVDNSINIDLDHLATTILLDEAGQDEAVQDDVDNSIDIDLDHLATSIPARKINGVPMSKLVNI